MLFEAKEIAKKDSKVALQKAAEIKLQNQQLNPGVTMTRQNADPIIIDPEKMGMQSQTYS